MAINEVIDDLGDGYRIIQNNDGFKFGIDAVLLSDFAKSVTGNVIDLCTGTGIVPILLCKKSKASHIDAVEIQREMAELAQRSVEINGLCDKISVKCADIKDAFELYGKSAYDAVTVNPPYMKAASGLLNSDDSKTWARHEVRCDIEDVIRISSGLLKPHGKLFMVHRPSRLGEIFPLMAKYKLEPKLMRLVAPETGKEPNMVLICGIRCANPQLTVLPTLYVYNNDGSYSEEIDRIYGRE